GTFKILPTKSNYTFPSKLVKGAHDGIYRNIYRGEFFHLTGGAEVIAPNIPMDPVNFDWNQQAKRGVYRRHPYLEQLGRGLMTVFFWYGFVYTLAYAVKELWVTLSLHTSWVIISLSCYVILMVLSITISQVRLWGIVRDRRTGQPIGNAKLVLTNPALPGMTMGSTVTNDAGKFLLRARPGKYVVQISLKNPYDGFEPIGGVSLKADQEGLINETVYIKQLS
ncbi:MAG TPA: carboxypeptidase-like regulatory domain-containing protein, partial [Patescibacteria group bacterium]|nr:carboxypeptidase-like regulatory domain-containing protein [Patescibacteria group bacterium]